MVGSATCGNSAGALAVKSNIKEELDKKNVKYELITVGCIGLCYAEPIITIIKKGKPAIFYGNVTSDLARDLVNSYILGDDPLTEFAMGTVGEETIEGIPKLFDLPVLKPQVRKILRNCGFIDPTNIDHYLAKDGYTGFFKAINLRIEDIISYIKKSGLRGRGGAGFPTWLKWQFCRDSEDEIKYIICNADEGDPGAFMNRSLLESDPHSVLEGILIAAYVIGAKRGYVYCRAEYP